MCFVVELQQEIYELKISSFIFKPKFIFMKNLFFLLIPFFFTISCQFIRYDKETLESYKISPERQKLLSIRTEDRRAYFDKLNNSQKVNIFKNKLEQVLQFDWSNEQRSILLEASSFLTTDFYVNPKPQKYVEAEKSWRSKALKVFSPEILADIVAVVDDFQQSQGINRVVPPSVLADEPRCTCSEQSDWCMWGFDCSGTCWIGTDNSGCGTWWGYACNGSCK